MEHALMLSDTNLVSETDQSSIDNFIDEQIALHSDNAEKMNLMALEASSLATSVESRSKGLESQGYFKRMWNDLNGSNAKVSARNSHDLATNQRLGQQMLNKLAKNNLITFQMAVALGDKTKRIAEEVSSNREEITKIHQNLSLFFTDVRQKLEQKFTSLERNDNLLFWKETMMHELIYQGKTYDELDRPEKMVCLANEFYRHSLQQWSPRDLSFLKSIIVQIGHQPTEKVQLKEVYKSYQKDNGLLKQLFFGVDESPKLHKTTEITPTLMAFGKLRSFDIEEAHIVDTIIQYAPNVSREEASLELTSKYIANHSGRDFSHEIPFFDAVMNLVEDLTFYTHIQKAELSESREKEETAKICKRREKEATAKISESSEKEETAKISESRKDALSSPIITFIVKKFRSRYGIDLSTNISAMKRIQGAVDELLQDGIVPPDIDIHIPHIHGNDHLNIKISQTMMKSLFGTGDVDW